MKGIGIFFRRQSRKRITLKQLLLRRQWGQRTPVLWALRNLDLSLYEGQSVGVVGHNGAGKSTLCLVMSQILMPDEGEVTIRGKVSTLVTLGAGLNRDLSGRANIQLYAAFLGMSRKEIDARIDEIIEFSGLAEFIDDPVRQYSSGMKSRLGFSVAATLEPEILILDEVFSVGDQRFRIKSQRRIEEMIARSRLIVIVSHNTDFLRRLCTHALWLDHGLVRDFGEAGPVLQAYDQAMGAPPEEKEEI